MKIYITNLSYLVTEEDLDLIFKSFGEVVGIKILHEKQSDLPVAIVEMKNDNDAREAARVLDRIDLIGHTIHLRFRNKNGERRDVSQRRIENNRRVLALRRSAVNRRINVFDFDTDDKRSDTDRRNVLIRRQVSARRDNENRRTAIDRRILA